MLLHLYAGSGAVSSASHGALHVITPSAVPGGEEQLWKNSYGNADKEAVQLAAAGVRKIDWLVTCRLSFGA